MKKRVFLDECCSQLGPVFDSKAHVYTASELGVNGIGDPRVIDKAFEKKCMIVTVNADLSIIIAIILVVRGRMGNTFRA